MKIPNDPKLSGSIVLVRGEHFLSKQIMMHMAIYARMTGRKPVMYSHAEFLIWDSFAKKLKTIGARESGTEISNLDYYDSKTFLVLKPKVTLNAIDNSDLWCYFRSVDRSKYQTGNFLAWITYLKTGIWLSKKGDNRVYCFELAARFADAIGRWPKGKSLDRVSIYDLIENPNYEVCEL